MKKRTKESENINGFFGIWRDKKYFTTYFFKKNRQWRNIRHKKIIAQNFHIKSKTKQSAEKDFMSLCSRDSNLLSDQKIQYNVVVTSCMA